MDPFTAVTALAVKYGAKAIVQCLGGSSDVAGDASDISGNLVTILLQYIRESEARVSDQLESIDAKLDQVLEQPFRIAQARGLRYLVDSGDASGELRQADLTRAREEFLNARAAARSKLQGLVSERYLLLTYLSTGPSHRIRAQIENVANAIADAALEALDVIGVREGTINRKNVQERLALLGTNDPLGGIIVDFGGTIVDSAIYRRFNPFRIFVDTVDELLDAEELERVFRPRKFKKEFVKDTIRRNSAAEQLQVISSIAAELEILVQEVTPGLPLRTHVADLPYSSTLRRSQVVVDLVDYNR